MRLLLCGVAWGVASVRAAEELDCTKLVPDPIDSAPTRSPQVIHTALLEYFAGRKLVEIGTRNGDGMACFARVARKAVAVELDVPYCRKLEQRAAELQWGRGYTFNVICKDYRATDGLDADYFLWWQQPPHLINEQVLHSLHALLKRGQIRQTAVAVMIFDPKGFGGDHRDFRRYRPRAAWVKELKVDELGLCKRLYCSNTKGASPRQRRTPRAKYLRATCRECGRARHTFIAMGLPLINASNASLGPSAR